MPGTDLALEKLRDYTGSWPRPADFDDFWNAVKARVDALPLSIKLERMENANSCADYYRATVEAADGSLLRAKYIRPTLAEPVPAVLQFHDYPGASRAGSI